MPSRFFCRLSLLILSFFLSSGSHAAPVPVVVCYPGGPVSEDEANKAMGAMLAVLERIGGWPAGHFESAFTSSADACEGLLDQKAPPFAITSLGLFLSQESRLNLSPLAQPKMRGKSTEQFHLIAARGRYHTLDELKGARVGGTVFEETAFIRRIVFQGKIDPQKDLNLAPSRQAIRSLRALDRGELDAVMLNGQQFAALDSLPLKTPLESVYVSPAIPLMGLVANQTKATPEDQTRIKNALTGLCADVEGKKLCDLFGIEAFIPADLQAINQTLNQWKKEP